MRGLLRALGMFVYRDLLYVFAGLLIVIPFGTAFEIEWENTTPLAPVLLLILAYVSCYVFQELLAIAGLACVLDAAPSNWLTRGVFNRAANLDFSEVDQLSPMELEEAKNRYWRKKKPAPVRLREQIERFLMLRDICVKFGTGASVGSLLYLLGRVSYHTDGADRLDIAVGVFGLFVGAFLLAQSFFRASQVAYHIVGYEKHRGKKTA